MILSLVLSKVQVLPPIPQPGFGDKAMEAKHVPVDNQHKLS